MDLSKLREDSKQGTRKGSKIEAKDADQFQEMRVKLGGQE